MVWKFGGKCYLNRSGPALVYHSKQEAILIMIYYVETI